MSDDLERRLRRLAEGVGETRVPTGLGARVRRRRRVRAAVATSSGLAGALVVAAVAVAISTGGGPGPDVPPAQRLAVPAVCSADDLLTEPAQSVPDDPAAQDFSLMLARSSPTSCTIGGFVVSGADGTERARATLSDVTLDPGATVDLRVRWDASATCSTQPQQLLADEVLVASVALPTCGALGIVASVRDAS